jgi:phosphocarrier protein HPr
MMLAASQGCTLTIKVNGQDEDAAMQAVLDLIEDRFEEGE